jgi:hypothetical protein
MNLVKQMIENVKARKRRQNVDYTHWDIHALARIMNPAAWVTHDATPGAYYMDYPEAYASFRMAANALAAGYRPPAKHLWSDAELKAHLEMA